MLKSGWRTATVLVAAGAVLALVAFSRPWADVSARTPGLPTTTLTLSGADLAAGAAALPLVLLAGLLALWAVGGWARRVVGALIVLVGLAVAVAAVRTGLGALDGSTVPQAAGLGGALTVERSPWWLAAALGGLAAAAGGAIVVARGQHWPTMGARYRRTPAPRRQDTGARATWDLLDSGVDPTLPETDAPRPPTSGGGE